MACESSRDDFPNTALCVDGELMARQAKLAFDNSGKPQNCRRRLVDGLCRSGRLELNREIDLEWDPSHKGFGPLQ
jgi:hypothetical protein